MIDPPEVCFPKRPIINPHSKPNIEKAEDLLTVTRVETSVRIYPLVSPREIILLKDKIMPILIEDFSEKPELEHYFYEKSGSFTIYDNKRIWHNEQKQSLEPDYQQVEKLAIKYLQKKSRKLIELTLPAMIPETIQPVATRAIFKDKSRVADHWQVLFYIELDMHIDRLPSGLRVQKFVSGSSIDMRIGSNDKIISITSTWRPIENSEENISTELFSFPSWLEKPKYDLGGATIAYNMNTVYDYQRYLAPIYNIPSELEYVPYPGSVYSLVFDICQSIERDGKIKLMPLVWGAERDELKKLKWQFFWAYYNLDSELKYTFIGQTSSNDITLSENGIYNVILMIQNSRGAVGRMERIVRVSALVEDDEEEHD